MHSTTLIAKLLASNLVLIQKVRCQTFQVVVMGYLYVDTKHIQDIRDHSEETCLVPCLQGAQLLITSHTDPDFVGGQHQLDEEHPPADLQP